MKKLSRKQLITAVSASSVVAIGVGVGVPLGVLANQASAPAPVVRDLRSGGQPIAVPFGTALDGLLGLAPTPSINASLYKPAIVNTALTSYTPTSQVGETDLAVAFQYLPVDPAKSAAFTFIYGVDVTALQAQDADVSIDSRAYSRGQNFIPTVTQDDMVAIRNALPRGHVLDLTSAVVVRDENDQLTNIAFIARQSIGYKFSVTYRTSLIANYVGTPGTVTIKYSVRPSQLLSNDPQLVGTREITYGVGLDADPETPAAIVGYHATTTTYTLTKQGPHEQEPLADFDRATVAALKVGTEFHVVFTYESQVPGEPSYKQYYAYSITAIAINSADVPTITGTRTSAYGAVFVPPPLNKQTNYDDWGTFSYKITTPVTSNEHADPRYNTQKIITVADFPNLPVGTVVEAKSTASPDEYHAGSDATATFAVTVTAQALTGTTVSRNAVWNLAGGLSVLSAPAKQAKYKDFATPTYTGSDGIVFAGLTDVLIAAKVKTDANYAVTESYVAVADTPNYSGGDYVYNTVYKFINQPLTGDGGTVLYGAVFKESAPKNLTNYFGAWTRTAAGKVTITKATGTGTYSTLGEYDETSVKNFPADTEFKVEYTADPVSGINASGPLHYSIAYKVVGEAISHDDISHTADFYFGTAFTAPVPTKLDGYDAWTGGTDIKVAAQGANPERTVSFAEASTLPVGANFTVVFTANPSVGKIGNPIKNVYHYTVVQLVAAPYNQSADNHLTFGTAFVAPTTPAQATGYQAFVTQQAGKVYISKPVTSGKDVNTSFNKVGFYAFADVARFPAGTQFYYKFTAALAEHYTGSEAVHTFNYVVDGLPASTHTDPGATGTGTAATTSITYGTVWTSANLVAPTGTVTGYSAWSSAKIKVTSAVASTANNYLAKYKLGAALTVADIASLPAGTEFDVVYDADLLPNYAGDAKVSETKHYKVVPITLQTQNNDIANGTKAFWDFDVASVLYTNTTVPNVLTPAQATDAKYIPGGSLPTGFGTLKEAKLRVTQAVGAADAGKFVVGYEFGRNQLADVPVGTHFTAVYAAQNVNDNYTSASYSLVFTYRATFSVGAEGYAGHNEVAYIGSPLPASEPPVVKGITWTLSSFDLSHNEALGPYTVLNVDLQGFYNYNYTTEYDRPRAHYTGTTADGQTFTYVIWWDVQITAADPLDVSYTIQRQYAIDPADGILDANQLFNDNATSAQKNLALTQYTNNYNRSADGTWRITEPKTWQEYAYKVISTPGPSVNNYVKAVYDKYKSNNGWYTDASSDAFFATFPAGTVYQIIYKSGAKLPYNQRVKATMTVTITVVPYVDDVNKGDYVITGVHKAHSPAVVPPAPTVSIFGLTTAMGSWVGDTIPGSAVPAFTDVGPTGQTFQHTADAIEAVPEGNFFEYRYSFVAKRNDNLGPSSTGPTARVIYRYKVTADGVLAYADPMNTATYVVGSTFVKPASLGFGPFAGYGTLQSRIVKLGATSAQDTVITADKITTLKKGDKFKWVWYYAPVAGNTAAELTSTTTYTVVNRQIIQDFPDGSYRSSYVLPYGSGLAVDDYPALPEITAAGYNPWYPTGRRVVTKAIPTDDVRYDARFALGAVVPSDSRVWAAIPVGTEVTADYEAIPADGYEGRTLHSTITYSISPIKAPVQYSIAAYSLYAWGAAIPGSPNLGYNPHDPLDNPATAAVDNVDANGKRLYGNFVWSSGYVITNLPASYTSGTGTQRFKIGQNIQYADLQTLPVGAWFMYSKTAPLVNGNYYGGLSRVIYYTKKVASLAGNPTPASPNENYDPTDVAGGTAGANAAADVLKKSTFSTVAVDIFKSLVVKDNTILNSALASRLGITLPSLANDVLVLVKKSAGTTAVHYTVFKGSVNVDFDLTYDEFGVLYDQSFIQSKVDHLAAQKRSWLTEAAFRDKAVAQGTDAVDAAKDLGIALDADFPRHIATIQKNAGTMKFSVSYYPAGRYVSTDAVYTSNAQSTKATDVVTTMALSAFVQASVPAGTDVAAAAAQLGITNVARIAPVLPATLYKAAGSDHVTVTYFIKSTAKNFDVTLDPAALPVALPTGERAGTFDARNVLSADALLELSNTVQTLRRANTTTLASLATIPSSTTNPYGSTFDWKASNPNASFAGIDTLATTLGINLDTSLATDFTVYYTRISGATGSLVLPSGTINATGDTVYYAIVHNATGQVYFQAVKIIAYSTPANQAPSRLLAAIKGTTLNEADFTKLAFTDAALFSAADTLGFDIPSGIEHWLYKVTKVAGSKQVTFDFYPLTSDQPAFSVTTTFTTFLVQ